MLGNNIHHFDIPGQHSYLVIVAESLLDVQPMADIPTSLPTDAWLKPIPWCKWEISGRCFCQRIRRTHAAFAGFG